MSKSNKDIKFIERFELIISKSSESKKDFAKDCGLAEKQMYDYLKGASLPGTKIYQKIKDRYPSVNLDWLISGNGRPFIESVEENKNPIPIDPAVSLVLDVEEELGVKLNDRQRNAVVAVLRKEFERRRSDQKAEIADLISSFTK